MRLILPDVTRKNTPEALANTKNLVWTISVILCLVAILVGFVYAAVNKYYYDHELPFVYLGESEKASDTNKGDNNGNSIQPGVLNAIPKNKGKNDYISSLTFLCDSTVSAITECGVDVSNVWTGADGSFNASSLSGNMIVFPGDGSSVTAANAAMISKPGVLVLLVGNDGLATTDESTFKTQYGQLISSILSYSPETQLICCSIASVTPSCIASDGLTVEMVSNANLWLKYVCSQYAVWYADTASEICKDGFLRSEFGATDGRTLNSNGINSILDYLNSHALE